MIQTQLKIIIRAISKATAQTEPQPLQLDLEGAGLGQTSGQSQMPFSEQELGPLLRALEINRSIQAYFTLAEIEQLRDWAIVAGTFTPDGEGLIGLSERDIYFDQLLSLVQERLYRALFPTEEQRSVLQSALRLVPPGQALHLRLELPAFGLEQMPLFQCPWELLCYGSSKLWQGQRLSISRYLRYGRRVDEPVLIKQLNILVITARPKELPVGSGDDRSQIRGGLRQISTGYPIQVRELPRATVEGLSDYLFEHRGQTDMPHALHFDGHGAFGRRCPNGHLVTSYQANQCRYCGAKLLANPPSGYLAFEKADGNVNWVSATELGDNLRDHQLKLVVLNACNSGLGRRGEDIFNGVAQQLIHNVPAVVASPFRLDWEAATAFARYFYQGVGQGVSLIEIMDRARQRLRGLADLPREWYRPVLYLRQDGSEAGQLFNPLPELATLPADNDSEAPLVYIHNFGDLPLDIPAAAQKLDWSRYFNRDATPRVVPEPAVWEKALIPELQHLRTRIGRRGLIRLRSTGALSMGFAFGQTFQEVGQYRLEVAQIPPTPPLLWLSDEVSPTGNSTETSWVSRALPGSLAKQEAVVIILAVPRRGILNVAGPVGDYLGEGEVFRNFLTETVYNLPAIEQILTAGFSPAELRQLCMTEVAFQPLAAQLSPESDMTKLAQILVKFADRQLLVEELLDWIKTNNPRRYQRMAGQLKQSTAQSQKFKEILFLEAEAVAREDRFIQGWEAAMLARSSRRLLIDLVGRVNPQKIHLFLATPFGLAVFLGHQWNAIGAKVQCHEYVGGPQHYAPACSLDL